MSYKEQVIRRLDGLNEAELRQVDDYLAFLKYRGRLRTGAPSEIAETAARYSEFAEEDRSLAEEGLSEYAEHLAVEDAGSGWVAAISGGPI